MKRNSTSSLLNEAYACWKRSAWQDAFALYSRADRSVPLAADEVELLATSAYLSGHDPEFHASLERAYHMWLEQGDSARAARCAFWQGFLLLFRGETAAANGWLARSRRLIADRDCVEQGYVLLPTIEQQLAERQSSAALSNASAAAQAGERFREPDLIACARHLEGRALIQLGSVERGLALLDETMIAVCAGELSPIVTGLLYCSVIDACQQVFAAERAREWTFALSRWCEAQPELIAFTDTCLVRRAEVMQLSGAWGDALSAAIDAEKRASFERRPPAAAFYRQAEIHRLRGELADAEKAYREASRLGIDPQPGLALLRLAQGRSKAAHATIGRALASVSDPLARAALLPAQVEVALAAGELEAAAAVAHELAEIAHTYGPGVLQAHAAHARGALELAHGRAGEALTNLRQAFGLWVGCAAPYEAARTRVLIAQACAELGDADSADLERAAARAVFEQLGAAPDLERLNSSLPGRAASPLTRRELQVLRGIAAGKTNKAIATELFISERTVDRHVSSILGKFGVATRAGATAWGYDHNLL